MPPPTPAWHPCRDAPYILTVGSGMVESPRAGVEALLESVTSTWAIVSTDGRIGASPAPAPNGRQRPSSHPPAAAASR